ncbi:hypothetical protein Dimus_039039 [Dionaea muscipula]
MVTSEVWSVQKPAQLGSSLGKKDKGVAMTAERPLIPGRVYTLTQVEAATSPSVVQGTLMISSVSVRVLFDSGATHSFASPAFLRSLPVPMHELDVGLLVSTPVGVSVKLHHVCRACEVVICGRVMPVDLVALDVSGFDVILGMDWLARHDARLDCRGKRVVFACPDGSELIFEGEKKFLPVSFVSCLQAQKMLRKGCTGFLAYVVETQKEEPRLEDIPIVNEFPDVFPEDLPGVPQRGRVEFVIDLAHDTGLISKLLTEWLR